MALEYRLRVRFLFGITYILTFSVIVTSDIETIVLLLPSSSNFSDGSLDSTALAELQSIVLYFALIMAI